MVSGLHFYRFNGRVIVRPKLAHNGYVLAMVGHLKNVSPTFAEMPIRITNVEFTTVSPTIANTMLVVVSYFESTSFFNQSVIVAKYPSQGGWYLLPFSIVSLIPPVLQLLRL